MNRENLIKKLDYYYNKGKYLRYSFLTKLKKYPLSELEELIILTLRGGILPILINKLLKKRIAHLAKVKTFFSDTLLCFSDYRDIYLYGAYISNSPEYRLTKFILRHITKENLIFFDIGAHVGYYSLLISKILSSAHVFAFEPNLTLVEILKINKGINKRNNITIIPKAVFCDNGYQEFFVLRRSLFTGDVNELRRYFPKEFLENNIKKVNIETITLDKLCEEKNLKPDFIKIDVDGSEEKVLMGAHNILSNHDPIIAMEVVFKPELDSNYKNSLAILRNYNFKLFAINDNGDLNEIYYDDLNDYFNYLNSKYPENTLDRIFDNIIFKK